MASESAAYGDGSELPAGLTGLSSLEARRALALVVVLAGYQVLMFAERLALPALAVDPLPRTRVFWAVWCASILSLVVILYVDVVAETFRFSVPEGKHLAAAIAVGVLSVGWRLIRNTPQRNATSPRSGFAARRRPT